MVLAGKARMPQGKADLPGIKLFFCAGSQGIQGPRAPCSFLSGNDCSERKKERQNSCFRVITAFTWEQEVRAERQPH